MHVVVAVAVSLGAFVLDGVVYKLASLLYVVRHGETAKGRIVRTFVPKGQQAGRRTEYGHVRFTTKTGAEIEFREFRPSYREVGTPVLVHYLPNNPRRATIAISRDLLIQLALAGCIAVVISAVAIATIIVAITGRT